jgi:hypothetical protein
MFTSTESRLWLAVHLLYPNASQAFDVYQAVVLQSEEAINQNNKDFVFSKLAQAFEKIPAISSNLSFYEFEFDQIDQWKVIYKNSQKIQLLIFVGVLIFEIKLNDIAPDVKLTVDKAQFLFHQIFKKLAQSSSKLKYNEPINLKKQNDTKISYLYTYENLVDFCLGQLSTEEQEKVAAGLELYPILQTTKDEYVKIISQIQNLKVQKSNQNLEDKKPTPKAVDKAKAESVIVEKEEKAPFLQSKKLLSAGVVSFLLVLLISFKLAGVFNYLSGKKRTVVIQEIEKKPDVVVAVTKPTEPVPESVPPANVPVVKESDDATLPVAVATNETKPVVAPPETKPEPAKPVEVVKTEPAVTSPVAKAEGGLYRGTLVVKDLAAVNAEISQKVSALGAKKAGEVELGWMKTPHMAYYHYIIPEGSIEEAAHFFKQLGALSIKFEKHPREVPAGSKRFIIEVVQK